MALQRVLSVCLLLCLMLCSSTAARVGISGAHSGLATQAEQRHSLLQKMLGKKKEAPDDESWIERPTSGKLPVAARGEKKAPRARLGDRAAALRTPQPLQTGSALPGSKAAQDVGVLRRAQRKGPSGGGLLGTRAAQAAAAAQAGGEALPKRRLVRRGVVKV